MLRAITTGLCLVAATTVAAQTPYKTSTPKPKPAVQAMKRSPAPRRETRNDLRKEAKITMATARATALKEVPNGRVHRSELERQNGKLVYSFDIKVPGKSGIEEVNVDAVSGAVASHEHETSKLEAKEQKTEKKLEKK